MNADIAGQADIDQRALPDFASKAELAVSAVNNVAQYFEGKQREFATFMSAQGMRYPSPQSACEGERICAPAEGINGRVAGPNDDKDFPRDDDATQLCWGHPCFSRESNHLRKTGTAASVQVFTTLGPTVLRKAGQ